MALQALNTDLRMTDRDPHPADEIRHPEPPLPEESGLTLEEYLAMQQAIGHAARSVSFGRLLTTN